MTINERVKVLRKEYLHLTLAEFGKRVGVGKTAISSIETGASNVSNQMFNSICREFSVNPDWLRDGVGDPIREISRSERIEGFVKDILRDEPEVRKARLIGALAVLDEAGWDTLYKIARAFLDEQNKRKSESDDIKDRIDKEVESYREDLEIEASQAEKSSTSEGLSEKEA